MGSGALFSIYLGRKNDERLKSSIVHAFGLIILITVIINILVYVFIDPIMAVLQVPEEVYDGMKEYLMIIFAGLLATSVYNFFSCLLKSLGNSTIPLIFLAISTGLNIVLDLLFVKTFSMGIGGAAIATVIAQCVSGVGIMVCFIRTRKDILVKRGEFKFDRGIVKGIANISFLTCLQQSVMNFGILMVQGLVNSFGVTIMAAFAAAVKIDTFAYLPVQDFGNAFSTFVAQNHGAGETRRIRRGTKQAFLMSIIFSAIISVIVFVFASPLMKIFVSEQETEVISAGVKYLRIEGAFYCGIACLFLLYGYYRAINKAAMSVVLTVISLGVRVVLAYILSAFIGETGIWMAIPIGWILADITGLIYMIRQRRTTAENLIE